MNQYMVTKEIFKSHNGIVRSVDITSQGIHNVWLNKLIDQGKISKIRRGIYEWIELELRKILKSLKGCFLMQLYRACIMLGGNMEVKL